LSNQRRLQMQTRLSFTTLSAAAGVVLVLGTGTTVARATEPCGDFGECKALIEINATDGDIGFHFLMDGDDLTSGGIMTRTAPRSSRRKPRARSGSRS
jgi:hypothetical protein